MPVWFEFLLGFVRCILLLPLFTDYRNTIHSNYFVFRRRIVFRKGETKYRGVTKFWIKWG